MKEKVDLEEQMINDHRELERIQHISRDLQSKISKHEIQILNLQKYLRRERNALLSVQDDSIDLKLVNVKHDMKEFDASMIVS
jgi:hypothetical protein